MGDIYVAGSSEWAGRGRMVANKAGEVAWSNIRGLWFVPLLNVDDSPPTKTGERTLQKKRSIIPSLGHSLMVPLPSGIPKE